MQRNTSRRTTEAAKQMSEAQMNYATQIKQSGAKWPQRPKGASGFRMRDSENHIRLLEAVENLQYNYEEVNGASCMTRRGMKRPCTENENKPKENGRKCGEALVKRVNPCGVRTYIFW